MLETDAELAAEMDAALGAGVGATGTDWIAPTEDAVAQAFAAKYAGQYVYDHTSGSWYIWRDGRWSQDVRDRVFHAAREFTRYARAGIDNSPASMSKIAFCAAVERASRADPRLAVSHEVWDRDPWLLGVPGGAVDLRTGGLRQCTPDLYIRRRTSVAPAPSGTSAPLWSCFLNEATQADKQLQDFLQRLAGYLLTGVVNEEVLAFFYGPGENGKGVFIGAIVTILAEYAVAVPIEVFAAGSRISLEYYRARMPGARLVTASETEAQAIWAESQIKEMTGNEAPLSARDPYGKPFTFSPQFKIVLVGNHAPKLKGRSRAMERRLRVIPFNHKPDKPDPDLKEKLRAEYPAILRWMIDGCLTWQRERLGTASVIAAATSAYFEQQDAFQRWMEERCIVDPSMTMRTKPGVLLADFNQWARENGEEAVSNNTFAELIDRTPGLKREKAHGVRLVKGIGLRASTGDDGDDR